MAANNDPEQSAPGYQPSFGLKITRSLTRLFGDKVFYLILLSAIIGVGGGYGAILFRLLIEWVNKVAYPGGIGIADLFALPWWLLILVPMVGGLIVGPMIHFFAREAKGHGVPEVMDAVGNRGGRIRKRVAVVKTLASAVSIGVGAAVGREGPIIQIGASLGSTIGQLLRIDTRSLKLMVGCGAAAGIAATFNAPIAGAVFALEVILGIGTISTFTPLVVSSVLATAVSRYHLGDYPAFEVPRYALVTGWELPFYVLLGAVCAVIGVVYSRGLYKTEDLWDRLKVHESLKPALGGIIIGSVAIFFPHVMGVGYEAISSVLHSKLEYGVLMLVGLGAAKLLATHVSLGSGFSGGIFAPALFIGAMFGGAFGLGVNEILPAGYAAPSGVYAVVAMGAVVAATVHAPLTAILIVFEMTSDYRIILPLMLACFIASVMSKQLSRESIFTLRLVQRGSRIADLGRDSMLETTPVEGLLRPLGTRVRPDTPFVELVDRAVEGWSFMYVTDDEGTLRGAIYLEDVSALIRDEAVIGPLLVAADVMRPVEEMVRPDDSLARCLRRLGRQGLEELPVVDAEGRLLGSITRTEIIALYDREVLRRETAAMRFVDVGGGRAADILHLPAGEHVEDVPVTSAIAGKSLRDLDLRARHEVHVLGVRHGEAVRMPDPCEELRQGDILVVAGPTERIADVRRLAELES